MAKTKSNKLGIEGIGRLEAEIMGVVWEFHSNPRNAQSHVTVRNVYEKLREKKQIAYTTCMTVMNNLAEKGLLDRDNSKTAHIYRATKTNIEVAKELIKPIFSIILGDNRKTLEINI